MCRIQTKKRARGPLTSSQGGSGLDAEPPHLQGQLRRRNRKFNRELHLLALQRQVRRAGLQGHEAPAVPHRPADAQTFADDVRSAPRGYVATSRSRAFPSLVRKRRPRSAAARWCAGRVVELRHVLAAAACPHACRSPDSCVFGSRHVPAKLRCQTAGNGELMCESMYSDPTGPPGSECAD